MKVSRGSRVCAAKGSITTQTIAPVKKNFTYLVQAIISAKLKHRTMMPTILRCWSLTVPFDIIFLLANSYQTPHASCVVTTQPGAK